MPKKRLNVNWGREVRTEDFKPALKRFNRYHEDQQSTLTKLIYLLHNSFGESNEGESISLGWFVLLEQRIPRLYSQVRQDGKGHPTPKMHNLRESLRDEQGNCVLYQASQSKRDPRMFGHAC